MDHSGANTLNKSVQNLWTNHRRTKLNLNNSTPTAEQLQQLDPTAPNPSETSERDPLNGSAIESTGDRGPGPTVGPSSPTPGNKRKVRPSRDDPAGKRTKTSANPGSSTSKDYSPPATRLSDLGGVQPCVEKMLELIAMPICHPEVYLHTGVQPPRGVLLHGPPGCGKTLLANAIAGELQVPFISVSAPSIVSGMSGESEKTLRDTFEEAKRLAPCLIFIDEIDAITPKRESAQREMERRIVAQLLTCLDDLAWEKTDNKPVMIIGATNRPDALDAALRRAGRFDHEISMGVPDEEGRAQILRVLSAKLRLSGNFDFLALAKATPGYVGADLAALTGAAGVIAVKRIFQQLASSTTTLPSAKPSPDAMLVDDTPNLIKEGIMPSATTTTLAPTSISHFLMSHPDPLTPEQLEPLTITLADFHLALPQIQPTAKREGFATIPDVTWADVGALHSTRDELHMAIVEPIRRPELFASVGIEAPCGVLLWGPPGCGKTLLAKAVANESGANFISVKGPELLNKYVGESERAVRQVFSRARASSPCIVFFDELDALVPRRDDSLSESSARVVNTLLTELDGLDSRRGVYVIGATNRPDMIDPAMCRPGRLDKLLYVDLPNADERAEIVRTITRKVPLKKHPTIPGDSDPTSETRTAFETIVRDHCDGFSGADLAALIREAGVLALRKMITFGRPDSNEAPRGNIVVEVGIDELRAALDKIGPSVSTVQRRRYQNLRNKLAGSPIATKIRTSEPEAGGIPPDVENPSLA